MIGIRSISELGALPAMSVVVVDAVVAFVSAEFSAVLVSVSILSAAVVDVVAVD